MGSNNNCKNLSIDVIRTDGGTQMRAELTQEVYLEYRDKWLAGVEFDPVDVFYDGSTYWLADGFHRFYGAREAKRGSIPCRIHQGTQRDAILFACGANSEHGLNRSPADKRTAVAALLEDKEWGAKSARWIAEQCKVSHTFVQGIKDEKNTTTGNVANRPAVRGKDGKLRSGKKSKPASSTGAATSSSGPPDLPAVGSQGKGEPSGRKISGGTTFDPAELTGDSKDAFGVEAPDELRQVFEICEEFDAQRAKLTGIKSWMTQRASHPGAAILVDAEQRIKTDIDQADEELKFAKPYCVCVYCRNKPPKVNDCNACKGRGWMTEQVYKAAPKGLKREKAQA